jgi:alpha-1,3-mannosyltransferase
MALYLVALAIVMSCYRAAGAPPYIFALLVLSKRLHSIFLLRLFNDGVAALFLWAAIYMLQKRQWLLGVLLWSFGVGVKMTLLLVAPAVAVILVLSVGLPKAVSLGVTCALLQVGLIAAEKPNDGHSMLANMRVLLQVLLGIPFLREDATAYLTRAFEFTRQFLFKWTVNWRFIGEETFLSISFSISLLASHIVSLVVLVAFRWIRPSRQSLPQFLREIFQPKAPRYRVSQSFILTAILESLAIGLLFARSLHYQFFAYIAWATPWLLWKSGFHPLLIISIWIAQEWAWNVFPSTDISSIVVVICLSLQVVGASGGKSSAATAEKTEKESVK